MFYLLASFHYLIRKTIQCFIICWPVCHIRNPNKSYSLHLGAYHNMNFSQNKANVTEKKYLNTYSSICFRLLDMLLIGYSVMEQDTSQRERERVSK
jgi:hypothetical protein